MKKIISLLTAIYALQKIMAHADIDEYKQEAVIYMNSADEFILIVEGHQYIVRKIDHDPECPCMKN